MNDAVLKSILYALTAGRVFFESALTFWTWLVVIGVGLELVFIVWTNHEERGEWFRALATAVNPMPSRPSTLKLFCELFSVLLVVIGIVGELRVETILGAINAAIADVNGQVVLRLQSQAASAATSAKRAQSSADELSGYLTTAIHEEEDARTRLETAKRDIRLLENETAWRRINGPELTEKMKPFTDTRFMILQLEGREPENLGESLTLALEGAGWKRIETQYFRDWLGVGNNGEAVTIATRHELGTTDSRRTLEAANALFKELGEQERQKPRRNLGVSASSPVGVEPPPAQLQPNLNVVVIGIGPTVQRAMRDAPK